MSSDLNYQLIGTWSRPVGSNAQFTPLGPVGICGPSPPTATPYGAPSGMPYGMQQPPPGMFGNPAYGGSNAQFQQAPAFGGASVPFGGQRIMYNPAAGAYGDPNVQYFNRVVPGQASQAVPFGGNFNNTFPRPNYSQPTVPTNPLDPEPPYMEPDVESKYL